MGRVAKDSTKYFKAPICLDRQFLFPVIGWRGELNTHPPTPFSTRLTSSTSFFDTYHSHIDPLELVSWPRHWRLVY